MTAHIPTPPPLVTEDTAHALNRPFAVTQNITGTLAPYVSGLRFVHVDGWLAGATLQQVVERWQWVQQEQKR